MLPSTERLLLGPGPSPVSSRVMRAMAAPVLSHLDQRMMAILDDIRARLAMTFRAGPDALTLAISGTGTSGMETAVANLTRPGTRALVVVTGYFGDRLAQMLERYGASVSRVDVEWGRACDPALVERALKADGADIVAMVHAETSTGVLNPVAEMLRDRAAARRADDRGCGHVARRAPGRCRGLGRGRLLQLHAEGSRRAVGAGADYVFRARATPACGVRRGVPIVLFRSGAARGLLAPAQVSPHDLRAADLRAARSCSSSKRKGSRRAGRGTAATISRSPTALGALGLALLPPPASGCGR